MPKQLPCCWTTRVAQNKSANCHQGPLRLRFMTVNSNVTYEDSHISKCHEAERARARSFLAVGQATAVHYRPVTPARAPMKQLRGMRRRGGALYPCGLHCLFSPLLLLSSWASGTSVGQAAARSGSVAADGTPPTGASIVDATAAVVPVPVSTAARTNAAGASEPGHDENERRLDRFSDNGKGENMFQQCESLGSGACSKCDWFIETCLIEPQGWRYQDVDSTVRPKIDNESEEECQERVSWRNLQSRWPPDLVVRNDLDSLEMPKIPAGRQDGIL